MKKLHLILAITALSMILMVQVVAAAPKFSLQPVGTWDADMINSDIIGETGKGVYIAVLDTGLAPNWKDYFPAERIATSLGKGFKEIVLWNQNLGVFVETGRLQETTWIGSTGATHGTHVTSTIIGYNYYAINDAVASLPLPPVFVKGIAPDATIIPVKVLSDYHIGKAHLSEDYDAQALVFGTDLAVAAGIIYATDLAIAGYRPMVITMSLGGPAKADVIEEAINYAIDNSVIVVASAGNEGDDGMGWPGAYEQVISVGACGWAYEWYWENLVAPTTASRNRLWWLQSEYYEFNDIPETNLAAQVYITDWSSRELAGQELDVVAPGSWVRGPYPGTPGYAHLPWWSNGLGALAGLNPGNFYYVGGTSMAAPHVTAVAAQMLEKNPTLVQTDVEEIMKTNALLIPAGSMLVFDLSPTPGFYTYSWGSEATGSGLIQANAAVAAVPTLP
jgi:subtilisin family serine protease